MRGIIKLGIAGAVIIFMLSAWQGQLQNQTLVNKINPNPVQQVIQGRQGEIQKQGIDIIKNFAEEFRRQIREAAEEAKKNKPERPRATEPKPETKRPQKQERKTETIQTEKQREPGPVAVRNEAGDIIIEPFGERAPTAWESLNYMKFFNE